MLTEEKFHDIETTSELAELVVVSAKILTALIQLLILLGSSLT